jgi:hypothetical protein
VAGDQVSFPAIAEGLELRGEKERTGDEAEGGASGKVVAPGPGNRRAVPAIGESDRWIRRQNVDLDSVHDPATAWRALGHVFREPEPDQLFAKVDVLGNRDDFYDDVDIFRGPWFWRNRISHEQGRGSATEKDDIFPQRTQPPSDVRDDREDGRTVDHVSLGSCDIRFSRRSAAI